VKKPTNLEECRVMDPNETPPVVRELKPQHTPGPWVVGPNGDTVNVPGKTRIAEISAQPDWQWTANARLIAAAPELLKALQNMLDFFEPTDRRSRACEAARAAIAKAVGD
jgi:hypothetical protein